MGDAIDFQIACAVDHEREVIARWLRKYGLDVMADAIEAGTYPEAAKGVSDGVQ